MKSGNCLPRFHSTVANKASASSAELTIATIPPRHSIKNFSSAGVSFLADGGLFPSFTSNKNVTPLNPTRRSGIPSPWVTIRTEAPALRRASTMPFWLSSILLALLMADSLSHLLTGDNITGTFLIPSTDRKQYELLSGLRHPKAVRHSYLQTV